MTKPISKHERMALRRAAGNRAPSKAQPRTGTSVPAYLVAHACFHCRKSWKVQPSDAPKLCPDCGVELSRMGRSFKAPKSRDRAQWQKVEKLWTAGFRFDSYRSHPNAEKLPETLAETDKFIARNPDHPLRLRRP